MPPGSRRPWGPAVGGYHARSWINLKRLASVPVSRFFAAGQTVAAAAVASSPGAREAWAGLHGRRAWRVGPASQSLRGSTEVAPVCGLQDWQHSRLAVARHADRGARNAWWTKCGRVRGRQRALNNAGRGRRPRPQHRRTEAVRRVRSPTSGPYFIPGDRPHMLERGARCRIPCRDRVRHSVYADMASTTGEYESVSRTDERTQFAARLAGSGVPVYEAGGIIATTGRQVCGISTTAASRRASSRRALGPPEKWACGGGTVAGMPYATGTSSM